MSLKQIKELLFQGKMEQLVEQVTQLPDKGAAKQFKTYFFDNQKRMQYAAFRDYLIRFPYALIQMKQQESMRLGLNSLFVGSSL